MIGYVKSKDTKKIQKVHQHLQEIGAKLDVDLYGNNSTAIDFFISTPFYNYDRVDYEEDILGYPHFKRIKIKDVMKTESWEDVVRLIENATR